MSAKDSIKSSYQLAIDKGISTGNDQIASKKNPIVIGGVNYGSMWNDQDAAAFNLYMSELGFQNELALMDYQNAYNSPQAQVQRMREAGLNPDLLGIEGHPSAQANQNVPSSSGGADTLSPLQVFHGSANILTQVLGAVQGAVKAYSDIKSGLNVLDKQEIDLTKDRMSLARDLFKFYGGAQSKDTKSDGSGNYSVNVHSLFGSRRQQRRWVRSVNTMWNDLQSGDAPDYATRSTAVSDEVSYNENRVKRASAPLGSSDPEMDLAGTINDLRSITRATFKYQQLFQKYLMEDNYQYQRNFSGADRGTSENEVNRYQGNIHYGRNNNIEDYIKADVRDARYRSAMARYQEIYNKSMMDMIYDHGLIGMLTAINMAGSSGNPINTWLNSLANLNVYD